MKSKDLGVMGSFESVLYSVIFSAFMFSPEYFTRTVNQISLIEKE